MEYIVAVVESKGVRSGRVDPNREILTEEGFLVKDMLKTTLTPEQAAELKTVNEEFDFLSGPVVALLLQRENAYEHFQTIKNDLDDIYASIDSWTTLRDARVFFPTAPKLERTMVLVKPGYSQDDYTKILETIDSNDFVLIGKLARIVSQDVAREMFNGEDAAVEYVTSDVSVALVIEKIGAVDEWQLLMGPEKPALAKQLRPSTLRACLEATSDIRNVVYGSESAEKARRDIAALFPAPFAMERTLAIVKPDVVARGNLDAVLETIRANEFTILASDEVHMSQARAGQFYAEKQGKPEFSAITQYMSSGPSVAMILGKPGAVSAWKKIIGPVSPPVARETNPDSLVAKFGVDNIRNGFHASETSEVGKEEIDFFFPQISIEKLPALTEVEDLLNKKPPPRPHVEERKSLNDVLMEGLTQLCRVKPIGNEAVAWLGEWLLRNNPNKPTVAAVGEEEASVGILDQISQRVGTPVEVVWALGSPGSGRLEQVQKVSTEYGHEIVDVVSLLSATENSGTEYGELLRECRTQGKPVPTHVSVNLVKNALANSKDKSKFLITGFPNSLDEAFLFEKVVGAASKIVYFDCSEATKTKRLEAQCGNDKHKAATAKTGIKKFKEEVYPIVDHYLLYGKVKKVTTDGSDEQIATRVKRHFR